MLNKASRLTNIASISLSVSSGVAVLGCVIVVMMVILKSSEGKLSSPVSEPLTRYKVEQEIKFVMIM